MKITKIDTFVVAMPWKNWLFVEVHTDEGISGIGEATVNAFARTVEAAIRELESLIMGRDPFQPRRISEALRRDLYTDGGQIQGRATAAIAQRRTTPNTQSRLLPLPSPSVTA